MLPQDIIRKKKNNEQLTSEELKFFMGGIVDQSIPDYQVSALLMAIYFNGLSADEMSTWTESMLHSGDVLDLSHIDRPKVDKHSTGGVGDKISLPLAPAVAACGVAVPMVAGRGLGHTGGTLDKLEAIPGFSVNLSVEQFKKQVDSLGVCLMGQTSDIAPADKRLYALRDVTSTVESIPLIASSIMSKKLAEGIDALVLDCKTGNGAFCESLKMAQDLAFAIQAIGKGRGKKVTALITDMSSPIGWAVGNALEVKESIDVLAGKGPKDTIELTVALGGEMLLLAGVASKIEDAKAKIVEVLSNGKALSLFAKMIEAQGGDPKVCDDQGRLPSASKTIEIKSKATGTLASIDSRQIGIAGIHLGAGRRQTDDVINPGVGIEVKMKPGEKISQGDVLAVMHVDDKGVAEATKIIEDAFSFDGAPPNNDSRIVEIHR